MKCRVSAGGENLGIWISIQSIIQLQVLMVTQNVQNYHFRWSSLWIVHVSLIIEINIRTEKNARGVFAVRMPQKHLWNSDLIYNICSSFVRLNLKGCHYPEIVFLTEMFGRRTEILPPVKYFLIFQFLLHFPKFVSHLTYQNSPWNIPLSNCLQNIEAQQMEWV